MQGSITRQQRAAKAWPCRAAETKSQTSRGASVAGQQASSAQVAPREPRRGKTCAILGPVAPFSRNITVEGVDLLSLSGGLRSLLTNSSVTKGNVIMENKDYDNFLLDLINVVNDEVNTLMGVEQQVTDD